MRRLQRGKQGRSPRIVSPRPRCPIATTGKVFGDGTFLEPIRDPADPERIILFYWDGAEARVGPRIKCRGRIFEPAPVDPTILRAMTLPSGIAPSGSARQLLHEIGQEITRYSALPERFASEASWFTLSTAFADTTPSASRLAILNPETIAANQLFTLLSAFCRRALPFSMATLSGLCSLPAGWQPTLLIRQAGRDLDRLLSGGHRRGEYIAFRGRLVELSGAIVTCGEFEGARVPPRPVLRIPMVQGQSSLPRLGQDTVEKLKDAFQPRMFSYRFANHSKVLKSQFDVPTFADPVRELACSLGACTPDDADLQVELVRVLERRNEECVSERQTDFGAIVVEAALFYSHDRPDGEVYIGEVAETVKTMFIGRGERISVTPHKVGRALDDFGLQTQPRNKWGYRLLMTGALGRRIHRLAWQLGVLPLADGIELCDLCRSDAPAENPADAAETGA